VRAHLLQSAGLSESRPWRPPASRKSSASPKWTTFSSSPTRMLRPDGGRIRLKFWHRLHVVRKITYATTNYPARRGAALTAFFQGLARILLSLFTICHQAKTIMESHHRRREWPAGAVVCGGACACWMNGAKSFMVGTRAYVSYANCGLPYHVGGVIRKKNLSLLVANEETVPLPVRH